MGGGGEEEESKQKVRNLEALFQAAKSELQHMGEREAVPQVAEQHKVHILIASCEVLFGPITKWLNISTSLNIF